MLITCNININVIFINLINNYSVNYLLYLCKITFILIAVIDIEYALTFYNTYKHALL